jgi:tRNA-dihydrouridine synthase B
VTQVAESGAFSRAWRIGDVEIAGPLVLGPMAGYTSAPLRLLCRRAGADLVCSEMVSAQGLAHGHPRSFALLQTWPQERPVAVQVFGGDPEVMAGAVPHLEAAGADIIDINMGCPVPKVLKSAGGAALAYDHDRAVAIAAAVVQAARVPVMCKIRAGRQPGDDSFLSLAARLQEAGAKAIAFHARSVRQGFRGEADHGLTARLVRELAIPVVASGDVQSPSMPLAILEDTGCAGVMIARGAIGRPWVFAQAADVLAGREPRPDPPVGWRIGYALCQAQMMSQEIGEHRALHEMRSHMAWYTRGLPGSARLRQQLNGVTTLRELLEVSRAHLLLRQP